jgi:SecD/SecF fusion protein
MGFLRNINYDFVGKRRTFYIISGVTILIGIGSLLTRGLSYGVEFKGGYSYVVGFDKTPDMGQVRTNLRDALGGKMPEVKTYGNENSLNITTDYLVEQEGTEAANKVRTALMSGLEKLGPYYHPKILGEQRVGSTVASDIKNSAWSSIAVSLIVIFVYIVFRFRRWQFALGAVVALAHDVLFVLTFFSLLKDVMPFSLDVDQAIIAALLTIAGYSMNDTVVVFDRIREFLANNKKSAIEPTINEAINKTLSRTIVTSFTIFVVVLMLFLFGGQVIKGFAFAMLIGIIIGTYSSIFVATPIVVDFNKIGSKKEEEPKLAPARA